MPHPKARPTDDERLVESCLKRKIYHHRNAPYAWRLSAKRGARVRRQDEDEDDPLPSYERKPFPDDLSIVPA